MKRRKGESLVKFTERQFRELYTLREVYRDENTQTIEIRGARYLLQQEPYAVVVEWAEKAPRWSYNLLREGNIFTWADFECKYDGRGLVDHVKEKVLSMLYARNRRIDCVQLSLPI